MMKKLVQKGVVLLLVLFACIGFFGRELGKSNAADGTNIVKNESYVIDSYKCRTLWQS